MDRPLPRRGTAGLERVRPRRRRRPADEPLPGDAAKAVVGDVLETDDGTYRLVTRSGPVQLTDFAAQVYLDVVLPDGHVARPIRVDSAPAVRSGDNSFLTDTRWPAALPRR